MTKSNFSLHNKFFSDLSVIRTLDWHYYTFVSLDTVPGYQDNARFT